MKNFVSTLLISSSLILNAGLANAQDALTKDDVRNIIREYLIENPELMLEVQSALEAKQQADLAESQKLVLEEQKDHIYSSDYAIEIGNPDASITVVEYFDYNCHFCQRAITDMQIMMKNNDNVRFLLKEFPVLGEASIEASRVSMAFSKIMPKEKHVEFHVELLSMHGQKDGDTAMKLALKLGADEAKLREEMENPKIIETIQQTYETANALGINGTPSYVVGDEVVFGAVGYEELEARLSNIN